MKTKHYRYLEFLIIALLIASMFLPWMCVQGEVGNNWHSYTLSATSIIEETVILCSRTLFEANLHALSAFQIIFPINMVFCALIPFVTLLLLVLTEIFTLRAKGSERQAIHRKTLMKWVRICIIAEAVFIMTAYISYSLCVFDLIYPAWGIAIALVLLIPEAIIRKKLAEEETNDRRCANRKSTESLENCSQNESF